MNVRNDMEGLKSLLGVQSQTVSSSAASHASQAGTSETSLGADEATVSSAGTTVSQAASASDVRMDKVTSVKSAIDSGTYNVPSSAVASKVVDSLLGDSSSTK